MSTFDPAALECLAAIVEEGGFERAAQRLNVTQSAVSQRLRALEAQVGSVLIVRSRPLRPTSAGQLLLKHTKQMRLLRADLERDLQELAPSAPGGTREDERISIAIMAAAAMEAVLEQTIEYTRERKAFGKPIGSFQLMQAKVADMYVALNSARAYVYAVAKACDRHETTREDAAGAILYAAEKATKFCARYSLSTSVSVPTMPKSSEM